ncbi:globin domain-containing protein [Nocardiopsis dassonvillei]|uniref:Globin n=1 Tax=Nocardiopsis dassonvillei (strain ATCC 23218 / DSM 43111 / CIP 107115 / JCM 7437 / KCTC 9190 / NBRC 14626 / NCTC 10488 / NRRL B-5397 / IMRU 509) TaxID=446468 RepID=D7B7Z3_NOCDD|nr:globin domain-containing protein [Nocardiopsis dassonvillei]ADH70301.1 globin [Nocardiopsis dassonvillei subsp. dassonvillei DSM 43111]VEI91208.1 bifunctional nitric oxide dioxygenase/dihydropteridine reductase 2 [Nocardiopsis dassonvillei]
MSPRSIEEVPLPAPAVIEAVRQSCSALPPGSTRLADRFYQNLFEMAPAVRDMFPANMQTQKERMAFALLEVVRYLDEPEEVAGYLRRLGAQHKRDMDIKPEHYPYVGRALVRAVSEVSPTWSSSMSSAWIVVYEWITANMLAGAREAESGGSAGSGESRTARHAGSETARHGRAAASPAEERPAPPAPSAPPAPPQPGPSAEGASPYRRADAPTR